MSPDLFFFLPSNDSEQEDSEVKKITEKMEQKQQAPTTQSSKSHGVKKTMILTSDQLKRLNLKAGMNQIEFSVTTALQGTTVVEANIFFFDHTAKFVISDIDGTITKSVWLNPSNRDENEPFFFTSLDPMCSVIFFHWLGKIGRTMALPNFSKLFNKMAINSFISLRAQLDKVESRAISYEISNSVAMHCPMGHCLFRRTPWWRHFIGQWLS